MAAQTYTRRATRWAERVCDGKIIAGKKQKEFCRRFLDDLKRAGTNGCPFWFDEAAAERSCAFIELLPYPAGEWGTDHIVMMDWQIFFVVNIDGFKWLRGKNPSDDDNRRFLEAYLEIGRGNAKTAFAAAFAVKEMCIVAQRRGQILSAATTGEQARGVLDDAREILKNSASICRRRDIDVFANSIVQNSNGVTMKHIASRASTQDGKRLACGILDELHAQPDRRLFDVIYSARGKFPNAISIYPTTAGTDTQSVCYDQHQLVSQILEGSIKLERYFGMIFTPDKDDNPFLISTVRKANPAYDVMPELRDEIKSALAKAKVNTAAQGDFMTKRLNMWLGATDTWLNVQKWQELGQSNLTLDDAKGHEIHIGVDLSDSQDISALCVTWVVDDQYHSVFRFYAPQKVIQKRIDAGFPFYRQWADEGHLILHPGNRVDHREIRRDIIEIADEHQVARVIFDPWQAGSTASELVEEGIEAETMAKNSRNYTDPCMEIDARVNGGTITHDANPVMTWMVSNAVIKIFVNKSILPKKPDASGRQKIDGIDALVNSIKPLVDLPAEPETDWEALNTSNN